MNLAICCQREREGMNDRQSPIISIISVGTRSLFVEATTWHIIRTITTRIAHKAYPRLHIKITRQRRLIHLHKLLYRITPELRQQTCRAVASN